MRGNKKEFDKSNGDIAVMGRVYAQTVDGIVAAAHQIEDETFDGGSMMQDEINNLLKTNIDSLNTTVQNKADSNDIPNMSNYWTKDQSDGRYLREHQDISGKVDSTELAKVAKTGNYNDLNNKPNIPTVPTTLQQLNNTWSGNSDHYVTVEYLTTQKYLKQGDDTGSTTFTQIQADWNETDTDSVSFIQNKPNLSNYALAASLASYALKTDLNDYTKTANLSTYISNQGFTKNAGTVTGVKYNNKSVITPDASGTVDLGTIGSSDGASSLNELSDVTITNAAADQILKYNGQNWVNASVENLNEQQQADWNEEDDSKVTYIQNKPKNIITTSNLDTQINTLGYTKNTGTVIGLKARGMRLEPDGNGRVDIGYVAMQSELDDYQKISDVKHEVNVILADGTQALYPNIIQYVSHGNSYSNMFALKDTSYTNLSVTVWKDGQLLNTQNSNYGEPISVNLVVDGNITIAVSADKHVCVITSSLNGAYLSNNTVAVNYKDSYETTISTDNDSYLSQVVITMGGKDITNVCYSKNGNRIKIDSVQDNVVITAKGSLKPGIEYPYSDGANHDYVSTGWRLNILGYNDGYNKFGYSDEFSRYGIQGPELGTAKIAEEVVKDLIVSLQEYTAGAYSDISDAYIQSGDMESEGNGYRIRKYYENGNFYIDLHLAPYTEAINAFKNISTSSYREGAVPSKIILDKAKEIGPKKFRVVISDPNTNETGYYELLQIPSYGFFTGEGFDKTNGTVVNTVDTYYDTFGHLCMDDMNYSFGSMTTAVNDLSSERTYGVDYYAKKYTSSNPVGISVHHSLDAKYAIMKINGHNNAYGEPKFLLAENSWAENITVNSVSDGEIFMVLRSRYHDEYGMPNILVSTKCGDLTDATDANNFNDTTNVVALKRLNSNDLDDKTTLGQNSFRYDTDTDWNQNY